MTHQDGTLVLPPLGPCVAAATRPSPVAPPLLVLIETPGPFPPPDPSRRGLWRSEERYEQYDKMSAYELFRLCGVSTRCYNEFLRPTLLVGLFAPPEVRRAAPQRGGGGGGSQCALSRTVRTMPSGRSMATEPFYPNILAYLM
jgi:hypothetical protein